jgi:hypothetical protein
LAKRARWLRAMAAAAEQLETDHSGVMFYVKCHTSYAPETETLLALGVGDLVAVVKEKETGWCVDRPIPSLQYSSPLPRAPRLTGSAVPPAQVLGVPSVRSGPHSEVVPDGLCCAGPRCVRPSLSSSPLRRTSLFLLLSRADSDRRCRVRPQVVLRSSKLRNATTAVAALRRMGGFSTGEVVHPGAGGAAAVDAPAIGGGGGSADDGDSPRSDVSPRDVNMSGMAAQMAAGMASQRSTTPPRVRTPERTQSGRISFACSKPAGGDRRGQLSPPKLQVTPQRYTGEDNLTPLASSMAINIARSRASTAAGGQSPRSPTASDASDD